MDRIVATQSDQKRAMHQDQLGWVDFRWGSEGDPPNARGKRAGAKGVAHIIEARMRKDGLTREQAIEFLPSVVDAIARGTASTSRYTNEKTDTAGTKAVIYHAGTEVVLVRDDGQDAWMLTGYEKPSDASGQGGGKAGATHVGPTPPRPDVGAEDESSIAEAASDDGEASNTSATYASSPSGIQGRMGAEPTQSLAHGAPDGNTEATD